MSKVSVVMPCRDAGQFLTLAITSVLGQDNAQGFGLELLIVDDASGDPSTIEALHAGATDTRVKVFRNRAPSGAAAARNQALRHSSGEYIAFLDADDIWRSDHLAKHLSLREEFSATLTSTDYDVIDEAGQVTTHGAMMASAHKGPRLRQLLGGQSQASLERPRTLFVEVCPAWTGSVVVDRKLLNAVGGFNEERRYAEDLDLWTRLSARSRFAFSSAVTAQYRRNPLSLVCTAADGMVDLALAETYADLRWHDDFRDLAGVLRNVASANFFAAAHALRLSGARDQSRRCAWRGIRQNPLALRGYRELLLAV